MSFLAFTPLCHCPLVFLLFLKYEKKVVHSLSVAFKESQFIPTNLTRQLYNPYGGNLRSLTSVLVSGVTWSDHVVCGWITVHLSLLSVPLSPLSELIASPPVSQTVLRPLCAKCKAPFGELGSHYVPNGLPTSSEIAISYLLQLDVLNKNELSGMNKQ